MQLIHGDCLEKMKDIPDKSIDMILCDLPYGNFTACKWDVIIPFEPLWEQYTRIIKDNRAVVLFGAEPFASALRLSNPLWYKYDWIWVKNCAVGFVNAKLKPMNKHEVICVFSNGKTSNGNKNNMIYNPQGLKPFNKMAKNRNKTGKENTYARPSTDGNTWFQQWTNYPTTILEYSKPSKPVHPTQKPVPLLEFLIKTYTNENDTVLDNTMGSGSTGCACVNTGRSFIGIEKEQKYYDMSVKRIHEAEILKSEQFSFV